MVSGRFFHEAASIIGIKTSPTSPKLLGLAEVLQSPAKRVWFAGLVAGLFGLRNADQTNPQPNPQTTPANQTRLAGLYKT